jgi:predicted AlkP superfamily phosphohydrolase/phosphomutase
VIRACFTVAWIALLACGLGCRRLDSVAASKKIIVLGIDAMDPSFLERHWDALPNLAKLRRDGDFKRLGTTIPPQSPVAWSTFTTGMNPGGHGIYDFIHRDPASMTIFSSMGEMEPPKRVLPIGPYLIPLSSGHVRNFRHGRAFWQILSEHGVPVSMLRMPNNFPPVECEGDTLSGMGTPDMRGTFGTFTFFTDAPQEESRNVSGGRIVRVTVQDNRAPLVIEGPENTMRKDHQRSSVTMTVRRDPEHAAALFEVDGQRLLLREGEWSGWIRVRFPVVPVIKSAAGMFRIYARKLNPELELYVSPVNIDPYSPELPISTPGSYSRELADAVGPFYTQGISEDTAALRSGVLTREEYRRQSAEAGREHFALLDRALDRMQGGLLFFHFLGIDQDSHMLWGTYETELLETYKRVDAEVGRVLARSRDATVMVMSDHGFSSFDRAVNLNTWLWHEGFLALDDPTNAGEAEMFVHVNWTRTKAYALGLNAIYINVRGREKYGSVEPGAETTRVVDEIARRLSAFRDSRDGRPVTAAVYKAREVYHGEAVASAPDLVVGWAQGFRASWQTALGAVPKELIEDNKDEWRGDHCIAAHLVPGVFLSTRTSRLPDPRLEDLTVTLLAEFGIPKGPDMTGRAIF